MLETSIAGEKLNCCIYNASGPRTGSVEALVKIAQSKAGAVLSKSATLVEQSGNTLPRFINKITLGEKYCDGSLNSEGLPNYGIDYYINPENISSAIKEGKPYIVSISGLSMEDNMAMLDRIYQTENISAIELNVACPNIPGKPMIAYDYDQLDTCIQRVCNHPQFKKYPLGLKLAPYFDIPHFQRVVNILVKYPIGYIVCTNTIPNGLIIDVENECEGIAPKQGLGGLGGGFVKHTALANVRTIYQLLKARNHEKKIDIVGVGGIASGSDAFEMILCGAKAVQVGTCHWTEGAVCFDRIAKELEGIMKEKGYKNIQEFCGQLKPYTKPAKKAVSSGSSSSVGNTAERQRQGLDSLHGMLLTIVMVLVAMLGYILQQHPAVVSALSSSFQKLQY